MSRSMYLLLLPPARAARSGSPSSPGPHTAPQVLTDGARLRQIILNGLTNAVKYSTGPDITLAVTVESAWIVFCVLDCGRGLPADTPQAELFSDFYALSNRRHSVAAVVSRDGVQSTVHSTGLGLPISHRYVDAAPRSHIAAAAATLSLFQVRGICRALIRSDSI